MIRSLSLLITLISMMLLSVVGWAETCPECPQGCIPSAYVEEFRTDAPSPQQACPDGCVGLDQVKQLRVQPGCQISTGKPSAQPEEKKAAEVSTQPAKPENVQSTQNRAIFFPTALSAPPKEKIFTGYAAGLWDMEYIINQNLQAGAYVVLPTVVLGIFPSIKAQFALSDNFSLGGGGFAGIAGSYLEELSHFYVVVFGGHTEATFHAGWHSLTAGLTVLGAGAGTDSAGFHMANGAIFLPNISYRLAFHRNWSFQIEMLSPIFVSKDGLENSEAIFVLMYGMRVHGEIGFGDFGFLLPLFKAYIDNIWKYTPIGIPYFSLGFKF